MSRDQTFSRKCSRIPPADRQQDRFVAPFATSEDSIKNRIYMDDPLRAGLVKRIRDCYNRRERINTERWWFWNKLRHGRLKPGVWGCKTNERGHPTAEVFALPLWVVPAHQESLNDFILMLVTRTRLKGNLIERKSRIWLEILTRQQHLP